MAALGPAPGDRVGDGRQELVLGAAVFVAELALASNGVDRGVEGASVVLDQAVVLFQYEQWWPWAAASATTARMQAARAVSSCRPGWLAL